MGGKKAAGNTQHPSRNKSKKKGQRFSLEARGGRKTHHVQGQTGNRSWAQPADNKQTEKKNQVACPVVIPEHHTVGRIPLTGSRCGGATLRGASPTPRAHNRFPSLTRQASRRDRRVHPLSRRGPATARAHTKSTKAPVDLSPPRRPAGSKTRCRQIRQIK